MSHHIVICGAGSAGCVLAARLTEDPSVSVLLLEGGPDYPTPDQLPDDIRSAWTFGGLDHDWGYTSQQTLAGGEQWYASHGTGEGVPVYRGKVVGGSSAVNGTNALRGLPSDFDRWVGLGNDAWSWEAVLPYFRRLESDPQGGEWHGADGPIPIRRFTGDAMRAVMHAFLDACGETGYPRIDDLNAPHTSGAGPVPLNQVDGVRQSTALTYLAEARGRPNLEVRADVTVDRVELTDGRARAVILASGERIAADLVVLSAGAIGSPMILQRSGIGAAADLRRAGVEPIHELPAVGHGLRDHPMIYPTFAADADAVGELTPPLQSFLVFSSAGSRDQALIDLHLVPFTLAPGAIVNGLGLLKPYSLGRVELASPDPDAAPRIFLNLFDHPEDLQRMVTGIRITRDIYASPALARFAGEELWPGPDAHDDAAVAAAILAAPTTYSHASCTCAMGPEGAEWAVVDQLGKLHGLGGLHVVDASIMPAIPSVPTNMTTIMMAERCADALRAAVSAGAATAAAVG